MYKVRFKCSFCDDKKKKNNDSDKDKIYVDSTGGRFRDRYTGHKYTFKRVNKKNHQIVRFRLAAFLQVWY